MVTSKQALEIIGCNKNTLTKYIADGLLIIAKTEVRTNFFKIKDIKEIAELHLIRKQKTPKKYIEIKEKETAPALAVNSNKLNEIGLQVAQEAMEQLELMGIYRKVFNISINEYAINYQRYIHFQNLAMNDDCVLKDAKNRAVSISPYFRIAETYYKQMTIEQNKLGLNPVAMQKLNFEEKKDLDDMGDLF